MSVVVKTYLERPGLPTEIRRFAVDEDVSSSFSYLSGKIAEIYPELRHSAVQVFWKDEEGDFITFSTDDELMMALGSIQGDLFRIYIKVSPNTPSKGDQLHPNVVCDACDGAVVGNRYKCAVCLDYDLCASCEAKGLHKEHFMMRLSDPCSQAFAFAPGRASFRYPPPSSSSAHCPSPPQGSQGPPPCWRGQFGGRGGQCGSLGRGRSEGRGRFFQQWMNWMQGEHRAQQTHREEEQSKTSAEDKSKTTKGASAQAPPFNPQDYLRKVGEQVAAMLDPLGIDVQVDARRNETKSESTGEKETTKPTDRRSKPADRRSKEVRFDVDTPAAQKQDQTPMTVPKETANEQNCTFVDMLEPKSSTTEPTPAAEPTAPIVVDHVPKPVPEPVAELPRHQDEQSAGEQPPTSAQYCTSLAPHVAESLRQMQEMGYTDDGGWLTQLLVNKNGDVSKVLDVLSPVRRAQDGFRA